MELKPAVSLWKIGTLSVNQEVGWLSNIKHASHCGMYRLVFCWECGNEIHIPHTILVATPARHMKNVCVSHPPAKDSLQLRF